MQPRLRSILQKMHHIPLFFFGRREGGANELGEWSDFQCNLPVHAEIINNQFVRHKSPKSKKRRAISRGMYCTYDQHYNTVIQSFS